MRYGRCRVIVHKVGGIEIRMVIVIAGRRGGHARGAPIFINFPTTGSQQDQFGGSFGTPFLIPRYGGNVRVRCDTNLYRVVMMIALVRIHGLGTKCGGRCRYSGQWMGWIHPETQQFRRDFWYIIILLLCRMIVMMMMMM